MRYLNGWEGLIVRHPCQYLAINLSGVSIWGSINYFGSVRHDLTVLVAFSILVGVVVSVFSLVTIKQLEAGLLAKQRTVQRNSVLQSPLNAAFLFHLFMTPQNADAITGDLEERYKKIFKKFGKSKADFWFWWQTAISIGPIVWAASKKAMKAVTGLTALVEFVKRIRP